MKHNAVILAAEPALVLFSPRKGAVPRRLHIAPWQAHSWTKKIVKLRKRSRREEKTQTLRRSDP
jgi:hypothetical protein